MHRLRVSFFFSGAAQVWRSVHVVAYLSRCHVQRRKDENQKVPAGPFIDLPLEQNITGESLLQRKEIIKLINQSINRSVATHFLGTFASHLQSVRSPCCCQPGHPSPRDICQTRPSQPTLPELEHFGLLLPRPRPFHLATTSLEKNKSKHLFPHTHTPYDLPSTRTYLDSN